MREIKFRGKSLLNNKWYEGDFITDVREYERTCDKAYILPRWDKLNAPIQVDTKTVRQFTGLKDKNNREIYEGDILQFSGRVVACGIVKYNENLCCFQACHQMSCWLICKESGVEVEITGNIYENQELLEGANPE